MWSTSAYHYSKHACTVVPSMSSKPVVASRVRNYLPVPAPRPVPAAVPEPEPIAFDTPVPEPPPVPSAPLLPLLVPSSMASLAPSALLRAPLLPSSGDATMFWVMVLPPPPLGVALVVPMLCALPARLLELMPVPVMAPVLAGSALACLPAVTPAPDPRIELVVAPSPVAAVVVAAEPPRCACCGQGVAGVCRSN